MGLAEYTLRCELAHLRALILVAKGTTDELVARCRAVEVRLAALPAGPMAVLAKRLGLDELQVAFLWTAVAVSGDARLGTHADAIGGVLARRGSSAALYADLFAPDADAAQALTAWLASPANPLVRLGIIVGGDDTATPASRPFAVPARVLEHLRGNDAPDHRVHTIDGAGAALRFDDDQRRTVAQLAHVLASASPALTLVVEGPEGSGRRTAAAHASGQRLVGVDLARIAPRDVEAALIALRREAFLARALPVLGNADALAAEALVEVGRALDGWDTPVIVTSSRSGLGLGTHRPVVRVRWPLPGAPLRRTLWAEAAGVGEAGLELLAHRYPAGPGAIRRAVASARTLGAAGAALDGDALATGLRHNIAERLGGLAHRVDVSQDWSDLVVADDTRAQLDALIARVRHAPRVLDQWKFKGKMARGTGVAALFSGPPGTGKSMCAGLIARELDLELYQVDLSQVVSKWIGETEKHLARLFDAAEEGHALLLFDEADALFGQRTADVKGANDRYANLEVNFLLQRVEAFGGITILTTNLDTAIDRALKRRLASHIVFDAPDEDERAKLWVRLTQTGAAPLDAAIDGHELARTFPKMTGAHIRNASLAAAFLAAADGAAKITQEHLLRAGRVEYRAMGHVLADRGRVRQEGP